MKERDMLNGKITYHQQVTYCGKPRCRKCREGIGHGPYWYAYETANGRTVRKYIGKHLPPELQVEMETTPANREEGVAPHRERSRRESHAPVLRIWTLGQFRVEKRQQRGTQTWQPVADSVWQQRSLRTLLAYILCNPERRVSRAQTLAALWPDLSLADATVQLNKDLHRLRRMLGHPSFVTGEGQLPQAESTDKRLLADDEWIALAGPASVWVDADAFLEQAAQAHETSPQMETEQRERLLREALALYNGDFLPEERVAEWAITRRQALRRRWTSLQLELADLFVAREQPNTALDILDTLLASDPVNEAVIQRLMLALFHVRRRSEAIRAYKRFEEVLHLQYQALPSEEIRLLYETIQQGKALPYTTLLASRPTADAGSRNHRVLEASPVVSRGANQAVALRSIETIGRTNQSALVGREGELALMRSMLLDVERAARLQQVGVRRVGNIPLDTQRGPQCLFLMGDSGIGKTRLAEEMSREAQQRGWAVVWSRLYTQEQNVPYRMWTEALQKLFKMSTGLVSVLSPELLQPLTTLLPAHLDSIPPHLFEANLPAYAFTPEQEKYRLWDAISGLLKIISEHTPLLMVLDDIQWADASSHDLLMHLARNLSGYAIMFVVTCRDTELPTHPPHPLRKYMLHMQREHTIKTLAVEPLTSEQIGQLVAHFSQISADVVKHIQDHAAGNPFFAEELARSRPPTLPKTVKDALGHRMQRLSLECRHLLSHAAVLGGSFEFQLLYAMETGGELEDEDVVLELLEEALKAGVLTDEGTGTRITYHFWHPLLVGYLYEDVSALRRARLHKKAAEALRRISRGREESVAATMVNHLEKAGANAGEIAHYAELAGNNAYVVSAYSEAAYYYNRAAAYLEQSQETIAYDRLVSLLERLAECTMIRGNYAEARALCERVLQLRQQHHLGEQDGEREAQIRALLWVEMAWTWRYMGDIARAWQCCEQSELILTQCQIAEGPAWARLFYTRSNLYLLEGRYDEALHSALKALPLFEQQWKAGQGIAYRQGKECTTLIQRTLAGDPVNLGRLQRQMGVIAVNMGRLDEALAYHNQALAIYEQYDEKRQIAHLSCNIGYIHLKRAEYEEAQAALRRSLNLAEHVNDDPLVSLVYTNMGELAITTRNLNEAEMLYRRALQLGERFHDREYVSRWNVGLARVLQEQGRLPEAATCIRRAWLLAREMHNRPCLGLALVALGNLRVQQALALNEQRKTLYLKHARDSVQRALRLDQLEVETKLSGRLILAQIDSILGLHDQEQGTLEKIIAEAQQAHLHQIVDRASHILKRTAALKLKQ